jgi:N-acetylglucosamine kinase-like BadF-type ATPase
MTALPKSKNGFVIGVDVGSTKTHAVVTNADGAAVGFGLSGPGNHEMVGYDGLFTAMHDAIHQALLDANVSSDELIGAGFGVSGYDWPAERQPTLDTILRLELNCPVNVVNDAVLGIIAGATDGWGLALVGGTGCNCRGIDPSGREGRVTGNGDAFGEFGGAGSIVFKALHSISCQWSCRGPHTELTNTFVRRLGARDVDDMIEGLVLERYHLDASFAPLVFEVAEHGDRLAKNIIRWAGQQLGDLAIGVIRQLDLENCDFDVVLIGGLFDGGELYTDSVRSKIHHVSPGAQLIRLQSPPVAGAVLLGMQQASIDVLQVRARVLRSITNSSPFEK